MSQPKRRFRILLIFLLATAVLSVFLSELADISLRDRRERACLSTVRKYAEETGLSANLVLAVIRVESDFRADAVSDAGAIGLMQIMPETFHDLSPSLFGKVLPDSALLEPEINIRCGCTYLAAMIEKFEDLPAALAAYNAGFGRVEEWLADETLSPEGKLLYIPFPETQKYVEKTLSAFEKYKNKY